MKLEGEDRTEIVLRRIALESGKADLRPDLLYRPDWCADVFVGLVMCPTSAKLRRRRISAPDKGPCRRSPANMISKIGHGDHKFKYAALYSLIFSWKNIFKLKENAIMS